GGQQVARTPVVGQAGRDLAPLVDRDQVVAAARQAFQRQVQRHLGRLAAVGDADVDVGAARAVDEGVVGLDAEAGQEVEELRVSHLEAADLAFVQVPRAGHRVHASVDELVGDGGGEVALHVLVEQRGVDV